MQKGKKKESCSGGEGEEWYEFFFLLSSLLSLAPLAANATTKKHQTPMKLDAAVTASNGLVQGPSGEAEPPRQDCQARSVRRFPTNPGNSSIAIGRFTTGFS